MSDEIGPVIQRLRSEQWSGEPGRGWRTYRLRAEEVWADGLITGVVNRWLDAHLGVQVVSIQYRIAIGPSETARSALILYREEVAADGAGGE